MAKVQCSKTCIGSSGVQVSLDKVSGVTCSIVASQQSVLFAGLHQCIVKNTKIVSYMSIHLLICNHVSTIRIQM